MLLQQYNIFTHKKQGCTVRWNVKFYYRQPNHTQEMLFLFNEYEPTNINSRYLVSVVTQHYDNNISRCNNDIYRYIFYFDYFSRYKEDKYS